MRPIRSWRRSPPRMRPNGGSGSASKCRFGGNSCSDHCCNTATRRRMWRRFSCYDHISGAQVTSQIGTIAITNGGGTIVITRPGFTVTINNWNTPPGQPVQVTAAQVTQYIEYLSSRSVRMAACRDSMACPRRILLAARIRRRPDRKRLGNRPIPARTTRCRSLSSQRSGARSRHRRRSSSSTADKPYLLRTAGAGNLRIP